MRVSAKGRLVVSPRATRMRFVFESKNLRRAAEKTRCWDRRDVPASSEKSNPCASRSSGTSSSASSCGDGEKYAKPFEVAESGGEASRQFSRVNRPRFARDLVVAFVSSRTSRTPRPRAVLRGRPEPDAPARPSKAGTIRSRPRTAACSAQLGSPRTPSRCAPCTMSRRLSSREKIFQSSRRTQA